ncbi:DUF6809 family protein [Enterocloster clostridioformis]|uniref:DUF6809 family protein n=1 Tax=Enterocloster clostridioformis TaxID=1531 RepID=UPI00074077DF|nr:DUF6809 family protein [Enterocloster clostridioformis]CUX74781.1 hypothetical protein BN3589_04004 [Clostridium sp. C105KSO14]
MNRILEAFAEDNLAINPTTYRGNHEYMKAIKVMYKTAETLDTKLNDEEKKLFEQFRDAQSDGNHIYEVDRFIRGYRVGVLMMVEVFMGASGLLLDAEEETA